MKPTRAIGIPFRLAMCFDGVDDYVDTPIYASFLQSFTLMAWVKSKMTYSVNSNIFRQIISPSVHWDDNIMVLWWVGWGGGWALRIDVGGADYDIMYNTNLDAEWHHVAGTFNAEGGTMKLYVDGALKAIRTGVPRPSFMSYTLKVGGAYGYWCGLIADACIYSRALSAEEVAHNYNNPDNPVRNGLILWLRADPQNIKDIDNDGRLEWIDLSGFGNHGKIYGAVLVEVIKSPARVLSPARIISEVV